MLIEIKNLTKEQEESLGNFLKTTYGSENVNANASAAIIYMETEINFRLNNIEYEGNHEAFREEYFCEIMNEMDYEDFLDLDRIDYIIQESINKINRENKKSKIEKSTDTNYNE